MSKELTDAEVKALTELSYKKSIKKENKMNNEFYMKGKEVGLGSSDGKFNTVYINIQDWNEIQKKLKALEIIKEKGVNVGVFLNRIKRDTDYKEYKRLCCLYKIMAFSEKDLAEKEFNLLKEVLL